MQAPCRVYIGVIRGYIGIMENKKETTILYRDFLEGIFRRVSSVHNC